MNAIATLNAFCKGIGLRLVTWEARRSQCVTEVCYADEAYAEKIAAILNAALDEAAAVKTVASRSQTGRRVMVRNFESCQAKIEAAVAALKLPKPKNIQDTQAQLQQLCRFSWSGETLRVGNLLQNKFPAIEPSCFVLMQPLLQNGSCLLVTDSEYQDDDTLPKLELLSDNDIQTIQDAFLKKNI